MSHFLSATRHTFSPAFTGWSDPADRDSESLFRDVAGGLISIERAKDVYDYDTPTETLGQEV